MAMTACPECGEPVGSGIAACSRCGYPIGVDRKSRRMRRALLVWTGAVMLAATAGYAIGIAFIQSAADLATLSPTLRRLDADQFSPWNELRGTAPATWIEWGLISALGLAFIVLGVTLRTRPRGPRPGLAGAALTMVCLPAWYAMSALYLYARSSDSTLSTWIIPVGVIQAVALLGAIVGIVLLFIGALRRRDRLNPAAPALLRPAQPDAVRR